MGLCDSDVSRGAATIGFFDYDRPATEDDEPIFK
jgi:hypothetical protein